ncbi:hypothetical protein AYI70_g4098 [Smittium culicis]|uniref:Uncharacterized protein n=1 Tax=Smittium culicis TaxID=133412 RepID=A0A1R1Y0Y7_9FUNG|nr:hypothetical protein AYI70_g4098 [Smittium culicis]
MASDTDLDFSFLLDAVDKVPTAHVLSLLFNYAKQNNVPMEPEVESKLNTLISDDANKMLSKSDIDFIINVYETHDVNKSSNSFANFSSANNFDSHSRQNDIQLSLPQNSSAPQLNNLDNSSSSIPRTVYTSNTTQSSQNNYNVSGALNSPPQNSFPYSKHLENQLSPYRKLNSIERTSPLNRRRTDSFRSDTGSKYSNNDSEINKLIKEKDDLKLELDKLQTKNISFQRELEISTIENQAAQKKLIETIKQDKLQMNNLFTRLEHLKKSKSTEEELKIMEDEFQRLALKVSNSEAHKEKLRKKLENQSSKIEKLVNEIQIHINEKNELQAYLESNISEKLKFQKSAEIALSKSKEMERKLTETKIIYEKLAQSQNEIQDYKFNIEHLNKELETSREIIEHYENNFSSINNAILPTNTSGELIDFQISHPSNSSNSKNTPLTFNLSSLFSKIPPNEFIMISNFWKKLNDTHNNQNTSSSTQESQVLELAVNLAKSDFLVILESYLSNSSESGSFIDSLKKSKNKKLLETLNPIISVFQSNNEFDITNLENTIVSSSTAVPSQSTSRGRRSIIKASTPDNSNSQSIQPLMISMSKLMIGAIIFVFVSILAISHLNSSSNSISSRTRMNSRNSATELNDESPRIIVRSNSQHNPRSSYYSGEPYYVTSEWNLRPFLRHFSFILSLLSKDNDDPSFTPT